MLDVQWATTPEATDLTREEYELFRKLVYAKSGINLGDAKQQLVRARLGKRIRQGSFGSFREYYDFVEKDPSGEELIALLDAISTNTTHLFREIRHFNLLHSVLDRWMKDRHWLRDHSTLRIWSAACSSGEEPHSLAMVVHDALQGGKIQARILATDLSTKVLNRAKVGLYDVHRVGSVPAEYRNRYLRKVMHNGQPMVEIVPELKQMITFSRFNLMTPSFPFRHGFDVIFCRNVMIYFDRPTQQTLVNKLADQLHPGGYLMIGHSESLSGVEHPLDYVEPTIYRKRA